MKKLILIAAIVSAAIYSAESQNINSDFFKTTEKVFKKYVQNGLIDYAELKKDADFKNLITDVGQFELKNLDSRTEQAYLINAYNLLVINKIIQKEIKASVQSKSDFFEESDNMVAGKKISLNKLEKEYLLKKFGDPRFHFVLVCGAKGCPPITDFAYTPDKIEQQLTKQTQSAVNDPNFIRVNKSMKKAGLSQIFNWYKSDFGGNKKAVLAFINKYRNNSISNDYSIDYYDYDWSLNAQTATFGSTNSEGGNNSSRYVVSAAIQKGSTETKLFNNLYTQKTRNNSDNDFTNRSNFYTASLSFLYGLTNRFNAGFDLKYRRVSNTDSDTSPFNVFSNDAVSRRSGITGVGPKIRWAPFHRLSNFSVQSSFVFPIGENLEGVDDKPYIDWDGAIWNTQLFNDFSVGDNFSVFTELDFLWEDIRSGGLNRFSTPATVIFSYFPNPKTTFYALTNFAPFYQKDFDYFAQAGLGAKYQVSPDLEFELLYTGFTNEFLSANNGRAATFNFGVRYSK